MSTSTLWLFSGTHCQLALMATEERLGVFLGGLLTVLVGSRCWVSMQEWAHWAWDSDTILQPLSPSAVMMAHLQTSLLWNICPGPPFPWAPILLLRWRQRPSCPHDPVASSSPPGSFLSLPGRLLSLHRASCSCWQGFSSPGEEGLPGRALQYPGWPLCGVVILAVRCRASQGWGSLSQGGSLNLSSLSTEGPGGNPDFPMPSGLWGLGVSLTRWCSAHTILHDPHR